MIAIFKRFTAFFARVMVDRVHTYGTLFSIELFVNHSDCGVGSIMLVSNLLDFIDDGCWLVETFSEDANQRHCGGFIHFDGVFSDIHEKSIGITDMETLGVLKLAMDCLKLCKEWADMLYFLFTILDSFQFIADFSSSVLLLISDFTDSITSLQVHVLELKHLIGLGKFFHVKNLNLLICLFIEIIEHLHLLDFLFDVIDAINFLTVLNLNFVLNSDYIHYNFYSGHCKRHGYYK